MKQGGQQCQCDRKRYAFVLLVCFPNKSVLSRCCLLHIVVFVWSSWHFRINARFLVKSVLYIVEVYGVVQLLCTWLLPCSICDATGNIKRVKGKKILDVVLPFMDF